MKEDLAKRVLKYNLQRCRVSPSPNLKTEIYDTDTVVYKATQIWSMLPTRYKNLSSLALFKSEIKNWRCSDCPCSIYRIFVGLVDFIT